MKCERSEGVGEAQNETGERERKRVGGKGQALPWKLGAISWLHVFPLVPHPPPTPFHFPPGPLIFPLLQPRLSSLLSFRSLYRDHTPSTFLSLSVCHIPLPPASLALYINHTLVFLHHLTLSSLAGFISTHSLFFPPFFFFSIFLSPPLFPLFTAAQIKPTTLCEILKRRDWKAEVQYEKRREKKTEKENKTPPDARELCDLRGREMEGKKEGPQRKKHFLWRQSD